MALAKSRPHGADRDLPLPPGFPVDIRPTPIGRPRAHGVGREPALVRILVTGGGGFLGTAISAAPRRARRRGRQRHALCLPPPRGARRVTCARGDIAEAGVVERAAEGCDAIIHVAARAGVWGAHESFHRVNVVGTQRVIDACVVAGIPTLVHTSTPSVVHAGGDVEGVDESAPLSEHFEAPYPETKAEAERRVLDANGRHLSSGGEAGGLRAPPAPDLGARGHAALPPRGGPRPAWAPAPRRRRQTARRRGLRRQRRRSPHPRARFAPRRRHGGVLGRKPYFITNDEPVPQHVVINGMLDAAGLAPCEASISPRVAYAAGAVLETLFRAFRVTREPPITRFCGQTARDRPLVRHPRREARPRLRPGGLDGRGLRAAARVGTSAAGQRLAGEHCPSPSARRMSRETCVARIRVAPTIRGADRAARPPREERRWHRKSSPSPPQRSVTSGPSWRSRARTSRSRPGPPGRSRAAGARAQRRRPRPALHRARLRVRTARRRLRRRLPHLVWQPTDVDADKIAVTNARASRRLSPAPARTTSATPSAWTSRGGPGASWASPAVGALAINVVHVAPLDTAQQLFLGAGDALAPGAALFTYGPYKFDGAFTSPSNADFDRWLKEHDPSWGSARSRCWTCSPPAADTSASKWSTSPRTTTSSCGARRPPDAKWRAETQPLTWAHGRSNPEEEAELMAALESLREALEAQLDASAETVQPVDLDAPIGRLSAWTPSSSRRWRRRTVGARSFATGTCSPR